MSKCVGCNLCQSRCPLGISGYFLDFYKKENKLEEGFDYLYSKNPLPLTTACICSEKYCHSACKMSIDIKELQFELANNDFKLKKVELNNKRIAVVGGGVAGLTTAWYYLQKGYEVNLFERHDKIGGELNLISETKLPKDVLKKDIERLSQLGNFKIFLNVEPVNIAKNYDMVFYCLGGEPRVLGDNGITYRDYLNSPLYDSNIAIIGGGKVAFECALHNKGQNTIFVRRNLWDMKIEEEDFKTLRDKHIRVIDNFQNAKLINDNTILGYIDNNEYIQHFDAIVYAIGKVINAPENILEDNEYFIMSLTSGTAIENIANVIEQLKEIGENND